MAPHYRIDEMQNLAIPANAVKSSVLILFYQKQKKAHVVFIKRPVYSGVHSGQIALPGGRWEPADPSAYHTALRESQEEIDIDPQMVELSGKLTDLYIPPSNYIVSPFVASYNISAPRFNPDPREVAAILEIPFGFFLSKNSVKTVTLELSSGLAIKTPCFDFEGNIIWGATAMIMNELVELWKTTV